MLNNRVTRIMMAAANMDNDSVYKAINDRKKYPIKVDTLEYGLDIEKVYNEATKARYILIAKDVLVFVFSVIAVIKIYQTQSYNEYYQDQNSGYYPVAFNLFMIAVIDWAHNIYITFRVKDILNTKISDEDFSLDEYNTDQNIVISGGYLPFTGSGFEVLGWSFTVNTNKPEDKSKEILKTEVNDLYSEIILAINKLEIENLVIEDEVFIDGRDIRNLAHEIPDILPDGDYSKPRQSISESIIKNLISQHNNMVRHYKVVRSSLWDGQIILSTFIRFLKKADTLFVEARIFMLPPLKQEYLKYDEIPFNIPPIFFIKNALLSMVKSFFIWIPISLKLSVFISGGWVEFIKNKEKRNKREIRDNKHYNYGWERSLRENWSLGSNYERFFQFVDKDFYEKMIKEAILGGLLESLKKRNISIEDFKQTSTTIFNDGIIVSGGNVNAEAIVAGSGASSTKKVTEKTTEKK